MKFLAVTFLGFVLAVTGCNRESKATASKHYQLTGKVISVNATDHTAAIDGAAIPGFMDAMRMDYPVPSASDLAALKPGENITATVDVFDDGSYTLSNIHPAAAGK